MTSTNLYEYCSQNGIRVYQTPLPHNRSVSVCTDGACAVGIDERNMTEAEKKVRLAHEIGHCERMAFYTPYAPFAIASQSEHRANVWAMKALIPKSKMKEAMKQGFTEVWQLAEHFEVTEDLIRFALWEYFDQVI